MIGKMSLLILSIIVASLPTIVITQDSSSRKSEIKAILEKVEEMAVQAEAQITVLQILSQKAEKLESIIKKLKLQEKDKLDSSKSLAEKVEYLETITSPKLPRSCHELFKKGANSSGKYRIDPDGPHGDHDPVEVFCDMEDEGVTIIGHDSQETIPITPCTGPDCYIKAVEYHAPPGQVSYLADVSEACNQDVTFHLNGKSVGNTSQTFPPQIKTWWIDRRGKNGAKTPINIHDTLMDSNFSDTSWFWPKETHTERLSEKELLPLTKLFFGGVEADSEVEVSHTIGPLKCRGRRQIFPEKEFENCEELYMAGVHHNGYHWIKKNDQYKLVYCNMEGGKEARQLMRDAGPRRAATPVHFHVYRTHPFNYQNKVPDYQHFATDVNSNFDLALGEFKVQTPGFYHFHMQFVGASVYDVRGSEIYLIKNFNSVNGAIASAQPNSLGVTSAVLKLQAGDRIYGRLFHGGAFSTFHGFHFFTGSLLDTA